MEGSNTNAEVLEYTLRQQLARLSESGMTDEKLDLEYKRTKSITQIGKTMIDIAKVKNESDNNKLRAMNIMLEAGHTPMEFTKDILGQKILT